MLQAAASVSGPSAYPGGVGPEYRAGQLSVTPAGQVMLGGLVSCTVMVLDATGAG